MIMKSISRSLAIIPVRESPRSVKIIIHGNQRETVNSQTRDLPSAEADIRARGGSKLTRQRGEDLLGRYEG